MRFAFQGILGADQPPYLTKPELFEGVQAHGNVAFVGGVEGAAEKPYAWGRFAPRRFMRGRMDHTAAHAIFKNMTITAQIRTIAGNKEDDAEVIAPHKSTAIKTRTETQKPSMYKVFLLNDDYTPMEFVVQILETFFNKSREEATRIMLHVHRRGAGLCGVYTFEVAETKVAQVLAASRHAQHPLQCTMEKE